MIDENIEQDMADLLNETGSDIIMALRAMHPNIWEDRKTWEEILLDDAKRISELLQRRIDAESGGEK